MSLIKCPICGKEISNLAEECVSCHTPMCEIKDIISKDEKTKKSCLVGIEQRANESPMKLDNISQNKVQKIKKTDDKYVVLDYSGYYKFIDELKHFNKKVIYVYHKKFGIAKVICVTNNFITVKFDSVGDKTFKFPESVNVHLFKVNS